MRQRQYNPGRGSKSPDFALSGPGIRVGYSVKTTVTVMMTGTGTPFNSVGV